ncbi:hypothetical protein N7450_006186 [Penicillium hetheringtonii]|uniref:THO complex subunit 2 n=1 Tax=Penicillium hetheringtonii TaxID=911720 RepID=A0AAD6DL68_9EURO|nr:hypothetical protein N7450_006186 [Penicillium hetheringtonii]
MAPGQGGGKRKRGERSYSGDSASNDASRPSPHRPGTLNMAHHHHPQHGFQGSPPREPQDMRNRSGRQSYRGNGGRTSFRRGSYENQQNFSTSQQKEPNAISPPPPTQPRESTDHAQVPEEHASQATPSPAPHTPASQPQQRPPSRADSDAVSGQKYGLTQGKGQVIETGRSAVSQQDLPRLASVFQELIRSAIYGRIAPAEAGAAVKDIIGEETAAQDADIESARLKASTAELDSRSLFLDTLSIVTDADTTNPNLKPLVFATAIAPNLMRLQLETPLLQSLGLVRDTFARMGIRKQTNLLYRQSNYNLLREESEGYSKLLTELFTTSSNEPPSSEVVEDTFEKVKAMIGAFDMDVGRVLDVTLDVFAAVLVKQYRFFVKLLRASSWWPKEGQLSHDEGSRRVSGLPSWALPGSSGWVTTDEERANIVQSNEQRDREFWDRVRQVGLQAFFEIGRKPLSDDEKHQAMPEANGTAEEDATRVWVEETGTLPPMGNRVAAQLLGFKLRFYASSARSKWDTLPDNLIYLAALLIKVGFISLRDLYAHLWRPDDLMDDLKTEKMTEKAEREKAARPGGGVNALMMAGALSDDTVPMPRLRDSDSRLATPGKDQDADKQSTPKPEDELPDPSDQKVLLLKSLLAIGAIPESLFVISKFPWLMDGYPELPGFIHRILHHSLDKVYTQLRPLPNMSDFPGEQQILSTDQSGVPKGNLRLAKPPARRILRWAQLDAADTNEGTDYRFYWDDWADDVPICQSVDDVFALCSSFLNLSGHKIGQDAALLTKLARIGKDSLAKDTSEKNRTRWCDLCKRLLLPAVSLTKANPGVVNEVFGLSQFLPRDVRYNMYAEWNYGQTSRVPDIKSAFDQARAETKDVLKRLSKTNTRPMARALAKIAYANPGVVINVAVSQIESYENLIEVVVECARYFTDLGYDILTWSLINSLGQKGRSRVQEGGLLTSRWLNALSTFAGRTFKRYSVMDPAPVLQYVVEQLRHNNSTDLIVLEQMISSMAGIITDNNFNDAQIQAMAGGENLQAQTILQLLDKRHESKVTSKRLLKSLTHTRLAGQLLVAIAQERLTCVFNESSSELKLLGNIFDEIHRILTQYLDLLRSNLSVDEFDSFVPDFASLIKDFGIQPEIAFWIRRTSVSHKIAEFENSKPELESSNKETAESSTPASNGDTGMDTNEDGEVLTKEGETMDVDVDEQSTPAAPSTPPAPLAANPVMQDLIDNVKSVLPPESWETVGAYFYATFWQLSPHDLHMPQKSYEEEIGRLKKRVARISSDRSDVSMAGIQRKEWDKKQLTSLQERLLAENKDHVKAYQQTRSRLQSEKDRWFAGMRLKHDALNISLLEQCFVPRLLLSPIDAFFCFKMLKFLHSSGTPNFRTVGLIDQLFREQRLTSLIFLCTSKEADNLGRFLNEILRDLTRWHADKAVYEKEAFGSKRDLPGFAKSVDPEGVPVSFLEFEDFRRLLYKWHRLFSNALKTCLNGGEYMHIRNAISVLKAVVQHFPAVNWIGRDMLNCVNALSKNDDRDDVKIPAASLIGDLNRREKKWLLPQAFNMVKQPDGVQPKSGSQPPTDRTGRPGNAGSQSPALNAAAPEFKPGSQDATSTTKQEPSKGEVEDGEIDDTKMADAASAKGDEVQPPTEPVTASKDSNAMDTSADVTDQPAEREQEPRARSRAGRQPDIPKRPEPAMNPRDVARLPRHTENRLPSRPDLMDDRRSRHSDFNSRSRQGAGPDHARSFEGPGPGSDSRGHGRDRDFGMRPPLDDPMRGPPYREGRPPRDAEWGSDRSRSRPDSFHGRDAPARGEVMPDFPDRPADGPRRSDAVRSEKDDRRAYPSRPLSPPRSDLPTRPERFPNDRRSGNFNPATRHEDFPRGPRGATERSGGEPDMQHGRLRGPEPILDVPSGPRAGGKGRNARNAPTHAPAPSVSNGRIPTPDRQIPTGPSRQSGRGAQDQPPATPSQASEPVESAGIHPDRLKQLEGDTQQAPPTTMTPPSGPRASGQQGGRGPGGDRSRSDKRFAGINNMLQQTNGGGVDRGVASPPVRGRGANRQSNSSNMASPQAPIRAPQGPAGADESGNRDRDRERRGDDASGGNSRREDRRDRGRDSDRERSRRSDIGGSGGGSGGGGSGGGGGGTSRDDKDRDRESLRRAPSSREEMRRRDRRDRGDDGPSDTSGPAAAGSGSANEPEGRPHQTSSIGAPPPPPPPPPPLPTDDNSPRRWGSGGDRGNRSEHRDRERERRGERGRDRDHHRESGGGHRKRGRPNPEDNNGEGGGRGARMGGDNKRPRRGGA